MNIHEILYRVKNDSIYNFVCLDDIKTEKDKENYNNNGYQIGYTVTEFKQAFPKINTANICFCPNSFNPTYYFDKSNYILFPIRLFGTEYLTIKDSFEEDVLGKIETFKFALKTHDYAGITLALNDKIRMEYFNLLLEGNKTVGIYQMFLHFYPLSDYGCSSISSQNMRKLMALKSSMEKLETAKRIKDLPSEVVIFRGEGEKSAPTDGAYSWTLDINQANFFASRYEYDNAKIIQAIIKKDNIQEFFDREKECIVMPDDVTIIESMQLYGKTFLESLPKKIQILYLYYRNVMTQFLTFEDSTYHDMEHSARVLFLSLTIAHLYKLNAEDIKILAEAAICHDLGRVNDAEDPAHGNRSAEQYQHHADMIDWAFCTHILRGDFVFGKKWSFNTDMEFVEFLIRYHCLPDSVGYEKIENNAKQDTHWKQNKDRITLLYKIFKDADGLDRIRFGNIVGDLDINQLRLPESKKMTPLARILLENLRIPE